MPPETRYARSGDLNIAYQVVGEGPLDLVYVPGWVSNVELMWEEPAMEHFLSRLASFSRLILFDKRGTGLSDRVSKDNLSTLEERMDDVRAVLEAVGSERAALFGHSEGGNMCVLFAATYPERTAALITLGCFAKRRDPDDDYPWAPTAENREDERGGRRAELGPLAAAGRRVLRPQPRRRRAVHAESRAVLTALREPRGGRRAPADELAHRRPGGAACDPRPDARPAPHAATTT